MVDIRFAVMHAPWSDREPWLRAILSEVPAAVVRDAKRNLWDTAKRAWRACLGGSTHAMVLQDDFAVVPGFVGLLSCLVEERPHDCVSPFQFPGAHWAIQDDYERDYTIGWRDCGPYTWGGCAVLPAEHVVPFLEFGDRVTADQLTPFSATLETGDDVRLNLYLAHVGLNCSHYYPPLMQHVGYAHSLIGNAAESWRKGCPVFPLFGS